MIARDLTDYAADRGQHATERLSDLKTTTPQFDLLYDLCEAVGALTAALLVVVSGTSPESDQTGGSTS